MMADSPDSSSPAQPARTSGHGQIQVVPRIAEVAPTAAPRQKSNDQLSAAPFESASAFSVGFISLR
jgi:hypothetical protein